MPSMDDEIRAMLERNRLQQRVTEDPPTGGEKSQRLMGEAQPNWKHQEQLPKKVAVDPPADHGLPPGAMGGASFVSPPGGRQNDQPWNQTEKAPEWPAFQSFVQRSREPVGVAILVDFETDLASSIRFQESLNELLRRHIEYYDDVHIYHFNCIGDTSSWGNSRKYISLASVLQRLELQTRDGLLRKIYLISNLESGTTQLEDRALGYLLRNPVFARAQRSIIYHGTRVEGAFLRSFPANGGGWLEVDQLSDALNHLVPQV